MGKYICATDATCGVTNFVDSGINFFWGVRVISVSDMVFKILNYVKNDKISNLVINGHGAPGMQAVGCGQEFSYETEGKFLYVDSSTNMLTGNAELYMHLLKPKFEPAAIVSLNGCSTGAGAEGDRLLKRLALILGVKVEAAADESQKFVPGYEGTVKRCDSNSCSILPATWSY